MYAPTCGTQDKAEPLEAEVGEAGLGGRLLSENESFVAERQREIESSEALLKRALEELEEVGWMSAGMASL